MILAAFALLLSGCASSPPAGAQAPPATGDIGAPISPPAASGMTLAQLATHNTETDCWVGYDGKVYDITAFLPVHKGGAGKIAPFCGTASGFAAAFEGKHGMSKVSVLEGQPLKGSLGQ